MGINKIAVITGATSGIGNMFARTLAKDGWDLIITGRRKDRLNDLKEDLSFGYSINVEAIAMDLTKENELNFFLEKIDKKDNIELLINNAGFGSIGNYFENNYSIQQEMIHLHITATTKIVRCIVPKMIKNSKGAIINVASLSAFFPAPMSYFYCSSKAFLVTFSECLHIDVSNRNIQVQALCPGFTDTEFHSRQGISHADSYFKRKLLWLTPERVVKKSLKSLNKNKVICIPGFINRLLYHISKVLPKRFYYKLAEKNANTFLKQTENISTAQNKVLIP